MSYEDDKAQLEFLADPMRVREQKRTELFVLAWLLLVSAASASFVAWVLIQIMLLMRIG